MYLNKQHIYDDFIFVKLWIYPTYALTPLTISIAEKIVFVVTFAYILGSEEKYRFYNYFFALDLDRGLTI